MMSSVCCLLVDRGIRGDVGQTDVGPGGTKEEEARSGSSLFSVCVCASPPFGSPQGAAGICRRGIALGLSGPALQPSKCPRWHCISIAGDVVPSYERRGNCKRA